MTEMELKSNFKKSDFQDTVDYVKPEQVQTFGTINICEFNPSQKYKPSSNILIDVNLVKAKISKCKRIIEKLQIAHEKLYERRLKIFEQDLDSIMADIDNVRQQIDDKQANYFHSQHTQ